LIIEDDRGSPFPSTINTFSSTAPSTPSLTSGRSLSSTSSVCSSSYRVKRSFCLRPQLENNSKLSHVQQLDGEIHDQSNPEDLVFGHQIEGSDWSCDSITDSSASPEPTTSDTNSIWSRSNSEQGPGAFQSHQEESNQPPIEGAYFLIEDDTPFQEYINSGNRTIWAAGKPEYGRSTMMKVPDMSRTENTLQKPPHLSTSARTSSPVPVFTGDLPITIPFKPSSDFSYVTQFPQVHWYASYFQAEQQPISGPFEQTSLMHPATAHFSFPDPGVFHLDSNPHWANFEPMQAFSTQSSVVPDPVSTANSESDLKKLNDQSKTCYSSQKATKTTSSACLLEMSDPSTHEFVTKSQPRKRKQFQCLFCDVEYTTKSAWIRHETELHESPKKWQCPDCKATFLNESQFIRHHKQNHSCHNCNHSNEAKIELPRKTAWGCGFCAAVFQNWEKRCEHVAYHFLSDGNTKSDWSFSNVITGLLAQKWVATAWQSLIAKYHGTNAEEQPKFQWQSNNPSSLELQQDLEHGQGEYEVIEETEKASRLDQLVQTAYRLGTSGSIPPSESHDTPQLCPSDSESM